MQRYSYWIILLLTLTNGYTIPFFDHDNTESQNYHQRLHQRLNSSSGILNNHHNASGSIVNPQTKTAAKAVACKSIGKGVCLGIAAAKYTESKLTESN